MAQVFFFWINLTVWQFGIWPCCQGILYKCILMQQAALASGFIFLSDGFPMMAIALVWN